MGGAVRKPAGRWTMTLPLLLLKLPTLLAGTGQDAYDKIKAGASLVEMYSRLSMEGPWCPPKIKIELRRLLQVLVRALQRQGACEALQTLTSGHKPRPRGCARLTAWHEFLQEDEYESLAEAVGADHRPPKKKAEKSDD